MPKFFNKPQLGQTQLQQAEQTSLSGVDNAANTKAAQADRSIDMLTGVASSAIKAVGKYNDNIEATHRLQSGEQIPKYQQRVRAEMSQIKNLEAMTSDEMDQKIKEINESFMDGYQDSPYRNQLKNDLGAMKKNVLNQMLTGRDSLHVKKVSDATAGKASSFAQQYAAGSLDFFEMQANIEILVDDSMVAHQVPTSNELDIPLESREKYMSLTRKQAIDSVMRGIMVQVGESENSKMAGFIDDKDFRKKMNISDGDDEYNKLVDYAKRKGAKADAFNYSKGVDSFKESLYTSTNQGIPVDIDKQVEVFRAQGNDLTAKDEHKLRKEFKNENSLVVSTQSYVNHLRGKDKDGNKIAIKDITAVMEPKEAQKHYNRAMTDSLDITVSGASIGNIAGALTAPKNQASFKAYIKSGGKIPKAVIGLFDVPSGASEDKWVEANSAITAMTVSADGSGYLMDDLIGVKQVSKIRGLARLYNDETMDEATKKNAVDAFHTRAATFNSKGYLQGTEESRVDPEWLEAVSKDAPYTTDDFVSNQQNADEISGNYQAYRLAGDDEATAQDKAVKLFEASNTAFEMPNGDEITIPRDHAFINEESIIAYSRDALKFPSLKAQRDAIGTTGWTDDWRYDRSISIKKSHSFAKTGKYNMYFNDVLVTNSSFTYDDIRKFISDAPHEVRSKITGVKTERPFSEVEPEFLENRKKNIKGKLTAEDRLQHIFDLTI